MRKSLIQRGIAIAMTLALLASLATAVEAGAATKACKKGFVRNKARKCVRKTTKKATTTTVKRTTATTQAAVKKGTIKLGTFGISVSGTTGAKTTEETRKVSKAWETMVNAAGGINGYKVEVLYRDTGGDNAKALAAVKDLEKEGVLALAGPVSSSQIAAVTSFINEKKLPIIGGQAFTLEYCSDPMIFPVPTCLASGTYGAVAAARDVGAKHFRNEYCIESAACASSVTYTRYAAQREGLKFSAEASSAIAPDYTAACLSAKNAGVDFFRSNGLNFANVVRDCSRQNYHPTYSVGGDSTPATIEASKGEAVAGQQYEFGIFYNGPEVQRFRQALATTDLKTTDSSAGQASVQTWLGFEMAGAIIKKLTQANPTRADFLEATYTINGEALGGQVPPMDFTVQRPGTGVHANSDCWTEQTVKDGQYFHMDKSGQIVNRLTYICGTGLHYRIGQDPS